jgi:trans-aconitate 2-methyltransferase
MDLRGDETVLDAGCGTGRLTASLRDLLPRGRVIGLDLSENMLRQARTHLLSDPGARVGFVCSDLVQLPFSIIGSYFGVSLARFDLVAGW